MADKGVAEKTRPDLWEKVKKQVTAGAKGGRAGQWSARKAQMATAEYKKQGGGYDGDKKPDNHLQHWTDEKWGTGSGGKSAETGERYLPEKAREALTDAEYDRSSAAKRRDTKKGRQFSRQPADIAAKTARHRDTGKAPDSLAHLGKVELMRVAADRNIAGRSRMRKADLLRALAG